jgi:DNA polymerase-3 subunit epsilon
MFSKLLAHFKRRPSTLTEQQATRLKSLQRKISTHCTADLAKDRIVVVDVESTGLSLANDHLIAIGAVAICSGRIALADNFEVVLRQDVASGKENILVHGIGGSEQRAGLPPEEALLAFLDYLDGAPLFAFHVAFDATMLRKAFQKYLGFEFRHTWADLAYVMPELFPVQSHKHRGLDEWLKRFAIVNEARHNALADAIATAQLGLIAMRAAQARRALTFKSLQKMEQAQHWMGAARY